MCPCAVLPLTGRLALVCVCVVIAGGDFFLCGLACVPLRLLIMNSVLSSFVCCGSGASGAIATLLHDAFMNPVDGE